MTTIIAFIILLISAAGIIVIVLRKAPVLADFSPSETGGRGMILKIKERIKNSVSLKAASSGEFLLLKVLSKLRIFALKSESKIACWLSNLRLRRKSIDKKKCFPDNYWEKMKTGKKGDKSENEDKESEE